MGRVVPMFSTLLQVEVVLCDGHGREVGELDIDIEEDIKPVMECATEGDEDEKGPTGIPCDIVAISRGFDFPEPQEAKEEVYTFYNVLWLDGRTELRIEGAWVGSEKMPGRRCKRRVYISRWAKAFGDWMTSTYPRHRR